MAFVSTVKFTAQEIASAPNLEPALEGLLRSNEVHEDIIIAFRVQQIKTRALFTALDSTEEGFKSTCKEAFGVNTEEKGGGFPHKREWAKLNTAWAQAKITGEAIERVNATKRAHGEPVAFLTADWTSLIREFKVQRGKLEDEELPAQSYYEAFEEGLHDGTLEAETLAHVVSLADEKKQRASRPEPAKQLGLHLDSTLTVQTKRRYMASMPQNTESLRAKYEVLTNLWLLAQSRQPGRKLYADLTESTWPKFLKELPNKDNFALQRDVQGEVWASPAWNHCLEYEFQLRKEALRRCFEEGYSIQAALWSAYADPQHRMKHWVQLLAIANCRGSSSNADSSELAQLRKKVADLERQVRSRSPKMRAIKGQSHSNTNTRAIRDQPSGKGSKNKGGRKGKGTGKGDKGKKSGPAQAESSGSASSGGTRSKFDELMSRGTELHIRNKTFPGFCFNFQSYRCKDKKCKRAHACAGCDKANTPYVDCLCLEGVPS